MKRAPRASNGPNHFGFSALQEDVELHCPAEDELCEGSVLLPAGGDGSH